MRTSTKPVYSSMQVLFGQQLLRSVLIERLSKYTFKTFVYYCYYGESDFLVAPYTLLLIDFTV